MAQAWHTTYKNISYHYYFHGHHQTSGNSSQLFEDFLHGRTPSWAREFEDRARENEHYFAGTGKHLSQAILQKPLSEDTAPKRSKKAKRRANRRNRTSTSYVFCY